MLLNDFLVPKTSHRRLTSRDLANLGQVDSVNTVIFRNYYLSNSKTFQDGNGNGNVRTIHSNDFQDGNWE